jgi:two-component system cell cycle response regulator
MGFNREYHSDYRHQERPYTLAEWHSTVSRLGSWRTMIRRSILCLANNDSNPHNENLAVTKPVKPADGEDHPFSVIVAEDDPATRVLLKRQLERAGYQVTAFENGRLALEAVCDMPVGILIADWNMPELDGPGLITEVCERLKNGSLESYFQILLTAFADKDRITEGLDSGADDYLTKPYNLPELLARVRVGERTLQLVRTLSEQKRELMALNERLEYLASRDALTGLYNRRVLFERLSAEWSQSNRTYRSFGCIMLDIDHFKKINDTHGHHAGDETLRGLAKLLKTQLRPYDTCGRFGGEEFLVLCPDTDAAEISMIAERIRAAIENLTISVEGVEINPTASIGAASRSERHEAAEDLVSEADELLYEAKNAGRNQVRYADGNGQHLSCSANDGTTHRTAARS